MVTTLILAATLASQCVHHKAPSHKAPHARPEPQCAAVLPYPQWQPRENEDSLLSEITPVALPSLTRYLVITTVEPCHVYSATSSGWGWMELNSGGATSVPSIGIGRVRAPEIDPRGGIEAVTILALGLIIIKGGRK